MELDKTHTKEMDRETSSKMEPARLKKKEKTSNNLDALSRKGDKECRNNME